MKLLFTLFLTLITFTLNAQLSKKQLTEHINNWHVKNLKQYSFEIKGKNASAIITRYHPERPEEKNDIIAVLYKGMNVQLKFTQPIKEISTHKDSLQKYFSYVSLENIYNEICSDGWHIYPRTPQSAKYGNGVQFTSGGKSISLNINWSIFTVMGYKESKKCNNELAIADGAVSEECYISVPKTLPLEVKITDVLLKTK